MSKEIYISTTPHETRLAIVEDEQLAEIYYERENEYTLAGSIYNGKVTRVLPGMQSAFVDVGLERDAFLYVTDFMEEQGDSAEFETDGSGRRREAQPAREASSATAPTERRGFGRGDRGSRRETPRPAVPQAAPTSETTSFDEPIAPRPVDDDAAEADGQGSRRWRGRRGRRRGRGSNPEGSASEPGAAGIRPVEEAATIFAAEAEPLSSMDAAAIEIDLRAEPEAPPQRSRDLPRGRNRGGRDRGNRDERLRRDPDDAMPAPAYGYGDEQESSAPTGGPVLLPGESIRKYRDPAEVAAEDALRQATAPKSELLSSSAPAIEIAGWDGGAVLPGETLSRHRSRQPESRAAASLRLAEPSAPFQAHSPQRESQPLRGNEDERHAHAQEHSAIVAAHEAELPEPTGSVASVASSEVANVASSEVANVASSEAPEETGGLTQSPAIKHITAGTHEYEPVEGESASLDSLPGQTYLRADLPPRSDETSATSSGGEQRTGEQPDTSNAAGNDHDQTTYDLDLGTDQSSTAQTEKAEFGTGEAKITGAPEHDFTALQPSGEMLSQSTLTDGASIPSQADADVFSPMSEEQAVASVTLAAAQTTPELHVAEAEEQMLPELHAYGDGDLEEEEIDGEEYELDAASASLDDFETEEYEEETLDGSADLGSLLDDIAADSHAYRDAEDDEPAYGVQAGAFTVEDFGGEPEDDEDAESQPNPGLPAGPASRRDDQPRRGSRDRRPGQRGNERGGRGRKSMQTTDMPAINDLLKPGQEILVQIAKEPIAKKGARITSHIALPGRFLVFMPTVNHTGVSRKISSEEERRRLKSILLSEKGEATGGFIVRTAAEGASEEELRNDLRFLIHLWDDIKARSESSKAPALIYHDLNLIERILRDQVTDNFSAIWVDTEAEYERVLRFLQRFQPSLVRRVKLYTKETPLFEHFSVTQEIEKALKSKVWLKSGGSIVINQTEALVAIDINTGKYVGKTARLEDTILKTNLDSIPEIVRQIRLRDLGGIIVIDFIDMDERKNRAKVLQALEDELKSDRAPSKVLPFNDFGLVIMTRKRVKQSLERTLCIPDPVTEGTGMIKSPVTIANEIYIEMRRMHRHIEKTDILLRVHPEVVKQLKASGGKRLQELEEMTHKTILVKSDPALSPEQFDIH